MANPTMKIPFEIQPTGTWKPPNHLTAYFRASKRTGFRNQSLSEADIHLVPSYAESHGLLAAVLRVGSTPFITKPSSFSPELPLSRVTIKVARAQDNLYTPSNIRTDDEGLIHPKFEETTNPDTKYAHEFRNTLWVDQLEITSHVGFSDLQFYHSFEYYKNAINNKAAREQRKPSLREALESYLAAVELNKTTGLLSPLLPPSFFYNLIEYAGDAHTLTRLIKAVPAKNVALVNYLKGEAVKLAQLEEPADPKAKEAWLLKRLMLEVMLMHIRGIDIAKDETSQAMINHVIAKSEAIKEMVAPSAQLAGPSQMASTSILTAASTSTAVPVAARSTEDWTIKAKGLTSNGTVHSTTKLLEDIQAISLKSITWKNKDEESTKLISAMPSFRAGDYDGMVNFVMSLSENVKDHRIDLAQVERNLERMLNAYARDQGNVRTKFTDGRRSDGLYALDAREPITKLSAMLFLVYALRRAHEPKTTPWFSVFRRGDRDKWSKIAAAMVAYQAIVELEKGEELWGSGRTASTVNERIKCSIPTNLHGTLTSDRLGELAKLLPFEFKTTDKVVISDPGMRGSVDREEVEAAKDNVYPNGPTSSSS